MRRKTTTVTARVTPRVRRLAEAAAQEEGATLSRFTADALEERACRRLLGDDEPERSDGRRQAAEPLWADGDG